MKTRDFVAVAAAELACTTEADVAEMALAEVMAELAGLEDPKTHAVNEKHGDDHGVNLGKLRALAKRLKTQQELACRLWETDDTAARLLGGEQGRAVFVGPDDDEGVVRVVEAVDQHEQRVLGGVSMWSPFSLSAW